MIVEDHVETAIVDLKLAYSRMEGGRRTMLASRKYQFTQIYRKKRLRAVFVKSVVRWLIDRCGKLPDLLKALLLQSIVFRAPVPKLRMHLFLCWNLPDESP